MQSAKSLLNIEKLQVKNEVITIDEDEIQLIKKEEFQSQEDLQLQNQHNGGSSKLIYYFEPQQESIYETNLEDKSKSTNVKRGKGHQIIIHFVNFS